MELLRRIQVEAGGALQRRLGGDLRDFLLAAPVEALQRRHEAHQRGRRFDLAGLRRRLACRRPARPAVGLPGVPGAHAELRGEFVDEVVFRAGGDALRLGVAVGGV